MALTERVVLYNDRGPQGVQGAEVWDRGIRPGARRRRDAARPAPAAPRRPGARPGASCTASHRPPACCSTTARRSRSVPTASCPRMPGCSPRPAPGAASCDALRPPSSRSTGCSTASRSTTPPSTGSSSGTAARRSSRARARRSCGAGTPTRSPCGTGSSACPTRCGCGTSRRPTSGTSPPTSPRARGSSTASRSPATTTPSRSSTTRSTPSWRTGRSAPARCAPRPGTTCRTGRCTTPRPGPGEVVERTITSKALRRQVGYHLYLPARFRSVVRYPLIVVHDGLDYLNYTSAKTVLDNLIHRNEIAEMVVAFVVAGRRPARRVRQPRAARPVRRPRAGARADRRAAAGRQPGRPHPDGVELRRGGLGVDGRPLPRRVRLAARSSRRRWSSPTSARTTAADRSSTRS